MAELKVLGFVAVVMLIYDPVPIYESLEAHGKLFDVPIDFVEAGDIVCELEFVGTDGGSGRCEDGKSYRLHL